ncbi:hypothetical protein QYE76_051662 [Lolium multiflorum]|uniref:TF-B3 domain-containing protein n=1 Tax=Lolium multiflorum TaxID=4521 RepID=A0AAD8WKC4_LOLMU|nr:hypothetical protein QYE76_051662 [Lolium multiflorum]
MSRVLVIGGTGNIGRHLVTGSLNAGHPTTVLARPATVSSDSDKAKFLNSLKARGASVVYGDMNDHGNLVEAIKQHGEVVISAVGHGRPEELDGQLKILEAIKKAGTVKSKAGPGGRRGGRGHGPGPPRGRGWGSRGGAGTAPCSPSPAPSSSSWEERCFEFLLRINDDPLGIKRLPNKFVEFVDGVEPAQLQLREASCNFCRWLVEVLFDGRGKMSLQPGWDKFGRDLALEPGCQLTFLYEREGEMIVKVFDNTSCRMHYHTDESGQRRLKR